MDVNQVYKNIEIIEKYLTNLNSFDFEDFEDFEARLNDYLAVSMSLFTILNACIELGESLIDKYALEFPQSYRYIFQILAKHSKISKDLAQKLSSYMKQRNMIAHQYDEVDTKAIYDLYENRLDFKLFVEEVKNHF